MPIEQVLDVSRKAYGMGLKEVAEGSTDPALKRAMARLRAQIAVAKGLRGVK